MAIKGNLARVKVSGTAVSMTAEATTNVVTNTVYQITNASKRVMPKDAVITVKVGGAPVTTGFTINRLNGKITFDSASVRVVTVDGFYLPMSVAAEANEFTTTLNADLLDATRFTDEGWLVKQQGLKSAEGSITEFFEINQYFATQLTAGNVVVVELYPDGTNPISMFALITSSEINAAVADLVTNSISFESTDSGLISYA